MALVSDVTSIPFSGLTHIDALLDSGPGWNWLTPFRSEIYYTFSVSSGNETGNNEISGGLSAFNAAQQNACLSQLSYISQLTGITFSLATSGATADLHFASTNIISSPNTSGLCSWSRGYSFDGNDTVLSYTTDVYVYLDNMEWSAPNGTPTSGSSGYQVLLHELGHALGLKHPFDGSPALSATDDNTANSIMSYADSGERYATFNPYDIAALMWLYGGDGLGGSLGVSSSGRYIVGTSSSNALSGSGGNDTLNGAQGDDSLDGGIGDDTAVYAGQRATYTIASSVNGFTITSAAEGTDTLRSIEFAKFADQTVTLSAADLTRPTVTTSSPSDEGTSVAIASNLIFTFSEAITRGTGSIILKNAAGATVATYDAASSNNLSISGSTLTINPTVDLSFSTGYKVEFAAGSIKDLAGNSYAGTTSYNFTTVAASNSNLILNGTNANEFFTGGAGNDTIDGGAGTDTSTYSGNRSNYTLTKTTSGWTVGSTADGTDTIQNVERLKFTDTTLALDIDGVGGQAYRVYQAAFNRTPDSGGLGFWINNMDNGASLRSVAEGFVNSAEFKALYGASPTNSEIVTKLYDNVLHRPGEAGGFNFWLGVLNNKDDSVAGVLAAFSESPENQVAMVGVIGHGFAYTPFA